MNPCPFFFEVGYEINPFSVEVLLLGYLVWDGMGWSWLESPNARQVRTPEIQDRFAGMLIQRMACAVPDLKASTSYTFSPPRFVPERADTDPVAFLRSALTLGWEEARKALYAQPPGIL